MSVMCISRKAFVRVMGPLKELLSRNMGEHARPSPRAALPCASPRAHPTIGISVSCAEIGVRGRQYSPCVSLIAHYPRHNDAFQQQHKIRATDPDRV